MRIWAYDEATEHSGASVRLNVREKSERYSLVNFVHLEQQTMIVEVQGMGFWTRVRLPSTPLQSKRSNTVQKRNIAVFKNEFGIILDTTGYGDKEVDPNDYPLTHAGIRQRVEDNYYVRISNSAITAVKYKCKVSKMDFKAGKKSAAILFCWRFLCICRF